MGSETVGANGAAIVVGSNASCGSNVRLRVRLANRERIFIGIIREFTIPFSSIMYPYVKKVSRAKTSMNTSASFSIPSMRLKNMICVHCKHKFYVQDLSKLSRSIQKETYIPLLLDCGHSICNRCGKIEKMQNCPLCNKNIATKDASSQKSPFPLNLYALGLIISSCNRPLENDDEDFLFCHTLSTQLRQISKQGCCHECGYQANVNCPQCMALYCYDCYSKIHGRALQSHTQVPICGESLNSPAAILNSCSPTCFESLNYFCNDCNVACCSNCTLCSHKLHDFVALSEKNQTLLPKFNQIYTNIEETLLRVCQTKEIIEKIHNIISHFIPVTDCKIILS
ncbi:hypothetical protein ACFW04_008085 [Cataglyphis niger]